MARELLYYGHPKLYIKTRKKKLCSNINYKNTKFKDLARHNSWPPNVIITYGSLDIYSDSSSGLVHTIKYMRHLTAFAYGTLDIYTDFSSDLEHNCEDSLKWAKSNVLTGFASSILNLSNTFFKIYLLR